MNKYKAVYFDRDNTITYKNEKVFSEYYSLVESLSNKKFIMDNKRMFEVFDKIKKRGFNTNTYENEVEFYKEYYREVLNEECGYIDEKIANDIFNLMSFDILCGQWDREEYNFFFECDIDNNVRIAHLCDNGIAFQNCYIYSSPFGEFNLDEDRIVRGNLPFILSNEKEFYYKLAMLLDIDFLDVLNRTCDKYMINIILVYLPELEIQQVSHPGFFNF